MMDLLRKIRPIIELHPARILVLGFASLILVGSTLRELTLVFRSKSDGIMV